ncbi:hypothetical protein L1049_025397 [Liquidambar formosana]|uniref:Oberon PHD finger domain-containing protein n=1 Tax=Liquidambar formosana TaxID=63359 RepID=A0AAP0NF03_LIQFO
MGKPEGKFSGTESVFSGFVLDPDKCSKLSLGEKRELVHEIAQWSKDAPEILRSWTRRELLEIICAEMGKERKYTGFTKFRMIQHLLNLVSKKYKKNKIDNSFALSLAKNHTGSKRQKKEEYPLQLPTDLDLVHPESIKEEQVEILLCQNLACRATLSPCDAFCKRCSCCICHHYDDNKDPSLWLTCSSNPPNEAGSCGMSCHLKCALKHERAGIMKNGCCTKLDGSFYCVSCGKSNGLMRTWRKQLLVAKDARRVDVLCQRISLSHKILKGTQQYKELQEMVETAVKKLKNEVGPLSQVCAKMARGIVNRLSCGVEVQKLCSSAVEAFDSMFPDPYPNYMVQKEPVVCRIQFEESSPTSVIIVLEYEHHLLEEFLGCRLWHRKSTVKDYPEQPTYIVLRPQKRFKMTDLCPSTEYFCKVSIFSSTKILGVWEAKWVTPTLSRSCVSALDEKHKKEEKTSIIQSHSQMKSTISSNISLASGDHPMKLRSLDDINMSKNEWFQLLPPSIEDVQLVCLASVPPSTPHKSDGMREVSGLWCTKRLEESDYDYSVKVIKWLECEGHIDEDFRVKFLTWFSLKATMQERRVVSVFVDTLIDDPPSLAGQLVDTFMDKICCEQKAVSRHGFCTRFFH